MGLGLTAWLYLRALGLTCCCAFVSLWSQSAGLIGSRGVTPLAARLVNLEERGIDPFALPTALWFDSSDATITALCALGTLASVALLSGLAPRLSIVLIWATYLSLVNAAGLFFQYQWDILLLEVSAASLWIAPSKLWPRRSAAPDLRLSIWLPRIILFKLMFLSGYVKLASGDESWRDLSAMSYHYWTQPIPNGLSHWVNGLPQLFHQGSVVLTFLVELICPFLIFIGRRSRLLAAMAFSGLVLMMGSTGNYGFFHLLTGVLVVSLLDDSALESVARKLGLWTKRVRVWFEDFAAIPRLGWTRYLRRGFLAAMVVFSGLVLTTTLARPLPFPQAAVRAGDWARSWGLSFGYGLFAVMTKQRPELVIEASRDGLSWEAYHFKYKVTDPLQRPPTIVPGHMPRLDWQLWFAALRGGCGRSHWVAALMTRLQLNQPEVLALIDHNPFPNEPPRYIRTRLFEYRPTTRAELARSGAYWERGSPRRACG